MALVTVDLKQLKGFGLADMIVLSFLVALVAGLAVLGHQWGAPYQATVKIDLSPSALFGYSLLSLARGFGAYLVSLLFTFWWALWAARSKMAERILIPLVDILQSIPVLGFMPGLVLGLVRIFPNSRWGLEIAGILLIFTSQAWNMILAFYQSLTSIPGDLKAAAELAGLSPMKRFFSMELPCGMNVLAWNSMMSMAGGWFFLTASEAFQLGDQDFRLPGVGSYMSVALDQGNVPAMVYAVVAMVLMVVAVDQLVWRPLLAWSFRFRLEEHEGAEQPSSWMLALLVKSKALRRLGERATAKVLGLILRSVPGAVLKPIRRTVSRTAKFEYFETLAAAAFGVAMFWGSWRLLSLLSEISLRQWGGLWAEAGMTLARTLLATLLGSLWAIPLGVKIGTNPRLVKTLGPAIQITASFPAPMLFPAVLVVLFALGLNLDTASVILMMSGTAWYILLNVIAGASQVPVEQSEIWALYGGGGWRRWRHFIIPSILPALLVGWETAMGGAWNASILTEYFRLDGVTHSARGLGATINLATEKGDFALLTAAVLVMVLIVVAINRLVWHRMYDYAYKAAHG